MERIQKPEAAHHLIDSAVNLGSVGEPDRLEDMQENLEDQPPSHSDLDQHQNQESQPQNASPTEQVEPKLASKQKFKIKLAKTVSKAIQKVYGSQEHPITIDDGVHFFVPNFSNY